jgi:hypothetical protein
MAIEFVSYVDSLTDENRELREVLARAKVLIRLLTVQQVFDAGTPAITASGLNPWCMNEGLATGRELLSTWWMDVPTAEQRRELETF